MRAKRFARCAAMCAVAAGIAAGPAYGEAVQMTGKFAAPYREAAMLDSLGIDRFNGRDGRQLEMAIERALSQPDVEGRPHFDLIAAFGGGQGPEGVLIATDMFGGTPSNLGITFLESNKVEVVTGVNLPMLIKAANLREQRDLTEVARSLREHGRNAIWVASDLLKGTAEP